MPIADTTPDVAVPNLPVAVPTCGRVELRFRVRFD
jgi:hypothetical protein